MSTKHKVLLLSSFPILIILGLLINPNDDARERLSPSTFSAKPNGSKALFQLLSKMGVDGQRFLKSTLIHERGTLVIRDPLAMPMSRREFKAIQTWVEKGNTLVIASGISEAQVELWTKPNKAPTEFTVGTAGRFLQLSSSIFLEKNRSTGTAILGSDEEFVIDVERFMRWKNPGNEWIILSRDDLGPLILFSKRGKGRIYAIADGSILGNAHIANADNLKLVLALLLKHNDARKVFFDEYHQGYGAQDSFSDFVYSSVFSWILLQSFIFVVLLFYSRRASYAGKYLSLAEPVGRSSTEYVMSMANILNTAKSGTIGLEPIVKRFVYKLSKQSGIPQKLLLSGEKPPNETTANILTKCLSALETRINPEQGLKLAQELQKSELLKVTKKNETL